MKLEHDLMSMTRQLRSTRKLSKDVLDSRRSIFYISFTSHMDVSHFVNSLQ